MVTQTAPNTPNDLPLLAPHRRGWPVTPATGSDVVLEREPLAPLQTASQVAGLSSKNGVVGRIVAPLLSVYDWLSGAPLTQRDRLFFEIEEADRIRRSGALSFIY